MAGKQSDTVLGLLQRGANARREEKLIKAHRSFSEATEMCRSPNCEHLLPQALNGLGQVERDLGNLAAAQACYEELADLLRPTQNPLQLAHAVRHLADVHRLLKCYDDAEILYREALLIYEGATDVSSLDIANATRPYAILLDETGRKEESTKLWSQARRIYSDLGIMEGVAECEQRLGQLDT